MGTWEFWVPTQAAQGGRSVGHSCQRAKHLHQAKLEGSAKTAPVTQQHRQTSSVPVHDDVIMLSTMPSPQTACHAKHAATQVCRRFSYTSLGRHLVESLLCLLPPHLALLQHQQHLPDVVRVLLRGRLQPC